MPVAFWQRDDQQPTTSKGRIMEHSCSPRAHFLSKAPSLLYSANET